MEKKEIRRAMKRLNLALTEAERAAASERLHRAVERLDAFREAETVALFASLPDEPDTAPLLARWYGRKRLVVPRVEGDIMQFYDYVPEQMASGAYGIDEPQADEAVAPSQIDFILVPGTAFTRDGARMGRGKGFYDKYMSQPGFHAFKAGFCYPHQLIEGLPVEPHDVRVDRVLCTEPDHDSRQH